MASLKRLLVGNPIRTARLAHERLSKKVALAIFASDALSSTAYATEQILLVLAAAYVAGRRWRSVGLSRSQSRLAYCWSSSHSVIDKQFTLIRRAAEHSSLPKRIWAQSQD